MSFAEPPSCSRSLPAVRRPVAVRLAQTRRAYSDNVLPRALGSRRRRRRCKRKRLKLKKKHRARKIVIVGDMACGKSCLVSAYCHDLYSSVYQPTILRCLSTDAKVQGENIELIVIDTPGRMDYQPIRKCSYKKADLVMICFALDRPDTLVNVRQYWANEVIESTSRKVPIVLVGNRKDKRDEMHIKWCHCNEYTYSNCLSNSTSNPILPIDVVVTYEEGLSVAKTIGALTYIECSAKYRENTRKVFEQSSDIAVRKHRRKRKTNFREHESCVIL